MLFILFLFFFFNDTAPTEIYTLSLHDALPIWSCAGARSAAPPRHRPAPGRCRGGRSEEHTSELQSRRDLVCRLLLEKKKKRKTTPSSTAEERRKLTDRSGHPSASTRRARDGPQ